MHKEFGGKVIETSQHVFYENYGPLFKDFVDYFNDFKKISPEHKTFAKLVINSLYGMLGMNHIDTYSFFILKDEMELYFRKQINILTYRELNNIALLEAEIDEQLKKILKIEERKTKNNIALACAITSKARIKLYKAQQAVIENGGRILYSDTDSIFAAYKKDVTNEQHGEIY